jgi:hypothetical protein
VQWLDHLANLFKDELTGYCDHCNKATLNSADYCHHCGRPLTINTATIAAEKPFSRKELSKLIQETNNLFLVWCCCIILLGAAALIYYFTQSISSIIVSGVLFLYSHIFFTTKLDELSIATRHSPQPIAFFSLLLPFIGTLFCHYRLEKLARTKLQVEVDA